MVGSVQCQTRHILDNFDNNLRRQSLDRCNTSSLLNQSLWPLADVQIRSDQIRSDIGLLRVDKCNSTIHSTNDTRNNVE